MQFQLTNALCVDGPSRTVAGNAMGTGGGQHQTRAKEPGGANSKNHGQDASKNNSSSLSEDAGNTTQPATAGSSSQSQS